MTVAMQFDYSFVFRDQLYDHFYYLAKQLGPVASQALLDGFIACFEQRISAHPESAPICIEAADLGFTQYHDYIDPALQLRVIYRLAHDRGSVYPLLFLKTKQSIRQALIQHCLRKE